MLRRSGLLFFVGFLSWALTAAQIPAPKICGSPKGPPVTAARIKLSDKRHLAYKEHGVPKEKANYKIVFVHGFDSCRHDAVIAKTLSPVLIHWLLYLYFFGAYFKPLNMIFLDLASLKSLDRVLSGNC